MFEEFVRHRISGGAVAINALTAGSGPPLLLLHGYPQSHVMWHKVAERLAQRYTVVVADLRGYGDSAKPAGLPDHSNYAKRAMAQDQVDVMRALGFERFFLAGHDRGGRVAHRLAVDHPERVAKLMVLDIAPTLAMYEQTDMAFARAYWWWFFLIQPAPFPETLIGSQPEFYLRAKIGYGKAGFAPFPPDVYATYLRGVSDPEQVHAMCEDYRAAASIDLEHDRADRAAGRGIRCPVHAIWGADGVVHRCFKPLEEWRKVTAAEFAVTGHPVPAGHYIAEEIPDRTIEEITGFFGTALT